MGDFLSLQKIRKSFFLNFPSRCCAVVYILCIVSVYKSHFNWKLGFLFSVSLWMYCFDLCCSPLWSDGFIVQSQTALRIEQYNPIQIRHTLFECVKSHGHLTGAYFFALVFINIFLVLFVFFEYIKQPIFSLFYCTDCIRYWKWFNLPLRVRIIGGLC